MDNEFLRETYLRIGRSFFEFDEKLHIQKIENGYLFRRTFYPTFDALAPDLTEFLKNYFEKEH